MSQFIFFHSPLIPDLILHQHNLIGGRQQCWKDCLVFICHAFCMYRCMDVGFSSTSKGKPSLSNENAMTDFPQTWYVGGRGHKYYPRHCHHRVHIFNTSFAYLFRLANNKKVKYPKFCMGYIDETWYVGSDGHKYYPRVFTKCTYLIPHLHICSDWPITSQISRVLYGLH